MKNETQNHTPTLADGCPIWEGQAVIFGSGSPRGRFYVRRIAAGTVEVDHGHTTEPCALVADLTHRPTALELGARIMEVLDEPPQALTLHLGREETAIVSLTDPVALLALWMEVSRG